jgi:hypothetical protein
LAQLIRTFCFIRHQEILIKQQVNKMGNLLSKVGKIAVISALCVLFVTAAFPQTGPGTGNIRMRDAMDYEGDDKADFTVFRPSNNVWYINKSNGSGAIITQWGLAGQDFMTPGDYDGDGKGDISVFRDTNGVWYRLNSSNGTFAAVQWGLTDDEPVARDYDGDGKTDVAVVRRSGGAAIWYILRSSDSGFTAVQWGIQTDFSAPGDYDGDGKFDLGVQRPGATPTSQAVFYVLKSSDGGVLTVAWGLSNDLVVPGDYDGDGKTDFSVVREGATPTTNLVWYVLRSSDGGLIAISFGLTGSDLNAQNDYDGDGRTDIAVWRDSGGIFYYLTSASNFTVFNGFQWGAANDYPVASFDTH